MTRTFYLYRFRNDDGTFKEWGYADLGDGMAEIRWGKAGALRGLQHKRMLEAQDRAEAKEHKGYMYVGTVLLDERGSHASQPQPIPAKPVRIQPKPRPKPVNIAELLGGEDGDGSWF